MKMILKPIDDSTDMIAVCNYDGVVGGACYIDVFLEGAMDAGPVYDALWGGHSVEVEVRVIGERVSASCGES